MLKQIIMDLAIEFRRLEEGQKRILLLIDGMKTSSTKTQEIYSLEDLAKMFKVTKRTIYNWKDQGLIPYVLIGSKTFVTNEQLSQVLKANEFSINNKRWRN